MNISLMICGIILKLPYQLDSRLPRHSVWKEDTIFECVACGKMYIELVLFTHAEVCPKMDEFLKNREDSGDGSFPP